MVKQGRRERVRDIAVMFFFFQAEDGIRDLTVTGVQTCALPILDPIGFSLENFDGIGLWRTRDEDTPVDPTAQVFDGTKIDGPAGLRTWLTSYRTQFTQVVAEKLLTYALGRGVDYQDMPLVRAIARDTQRSGGRFSSLVLGVVGSTPFQMNMKAREAPTPTSAAAAADSRKGARESCISRRSTFRGGAF